jgi:hypothetical protein
VALIYKVHATPEVTPTLAVRDFPPALAAASPVQLFELWSTWVEMRLSRGQVEARRAAEEGFIGAPW